MYCLKAILHEMAHLKHFNFRNKIEKKDHSEPKCKISSEPEAREHFEFKILSGMLY